MKNLDCKSILRQIPTEIKIKRELRKICFGKYLRCPLCGTRNLKKYEARYHCKRCRRFFSLKSVSWFKGSKLSWQTLWLLLWCFVNKVPVDQTMKISGKSEITVRHWFDKFRANLPQEIGLRLKGIVQGDEFYRGGKKNGYSIIGMKQKGTRKVVLEVIKKPSVNRKDIVKVLAQTVIPGSKFYTDGSSIYKTIEKWWIVRHQCELHKNFEFELTSEIEGVWGNFITFIRRMYHHITLDKLEEYVHEFQMRFSHPKIFESPFMFLQFTLSTVSSC